MHARRPTPLLVSLSTLAAATDLTVETWEGWARTGRVRAIRLRPPLHYTDDRPRKPDYKGRWMVPIEEVERVLTEAYAGGDVPRGLMLKLRRLAKPMPLPAESPKGPSSK